MPAKTGSTESRVQSFIHSIEQGRFSTILRGSVIAVVIIAVALVYLGWRFRGFALPEAMDQAQVAREIARGHGWSTQFLRPLALWQFAENKLPLPKDDFPDTYNAPLPPLVNSLAIKLAGDKVKFGEHEYIAPSERLIVALSMLCFLASIGVEYLLLRRLFDARLAFWASSATLVSDLCWQFTLSGLPQMLMLLIFNGALYSLVRALQNHRALESARSQGVEPSVPSPREGKPPETARPGKVLLWMAAAGVLFGLLTLSHAITIWLFAGALIYSAIHFRRRGPVVLILLLAFALVYAPWMARNYRVSGSAFGLAQYELYGGVVTSTSQRMRSVTDPMTSSVQPYFFRPKIQHGICDQLNQLTGSLGGNVLAVAFFLGLVHVFRRAEVNSFRWAVLLMWGLAVFGMGLAAPGDTDAALAIGPNQIGVLFLPVMLGFGLAYVLVLFSRRESASGAVAQLVFFATLFVVSALPLVFSLLPNNGSPFQYPPYFEPGINRLAAWTNPGEIIVSDMPWAVAWYADRKSLWLPNKIKEITDLGDNSRLPGSVAGVFLTPISRNTPLFTSVIRGEYSDYQPLIFGQTNIPYFPFREVLPVMGDPTTYLFFSDTRRWEHDKPTP